VTSVVKKELKKQFLKVFNANITKKANDANFFDCLKNAQALGVF